ARRGGCGGGGRAAPPPPVHPRAGGGRPPARPAKSERHARRGGGERTEGGIYLAAFSPRSLSPRPLCSAMTASSVSLAAVTPMRSKHSATMLLDAVRRLMSRSIGVILARW